MLLIAIGTQVSILLWVGVALIVLVILRVLVGMLKQMYF